MKRSRQPRKEREGDELKLSMIGPFSWTELLTKDEADGAGVYLWVVPYKDAFRIYYVGETGRSFNERHAEHTVFQLSGQYHINEFRDGEKEMLWPGNLKNEPEKLAEYIDRGLTEANARLMKDMHFFLIPTDCERRLRQRIESAIAAEGGPLQEEGIRYVRRQHDKTVKIEGAELVGLPPELEC